MYYRNPDYIDIDRLAKAARAIPDRAPLSRTDRLLLSMGMILVPVVAFSLVLGLGRLIAAG